MPDAPLPELVEIVPPQLPLGALWRPSVGQETLDLLDHLGRVSGLSDESKGRLCDEAIRVLSRCTPPTTDTDSQTGLVVGHVQSGKTMSFTTVAALARDNNYRLVIVITGISTNLFDQSKRRLRRDLRLDSPRDRRWQFFENPRPGGVDLQSMQGLVADWRDRNVPEAQRQTILVAVMKNRTHLTNLVNLLRQLELQGAPALVIDDEADQAGLNTQVRRAGESTTYRQLLDLRRVLPHHSYLQYTATPQAPLLLNLIDTLSPRFAKVLTPGRDYIGGRDLFIDRANQIREIPSQEIPTRQAPLQEPPATLIYAMKLFFLGAAAGYIPGPPVGNRTMMVHPSQQVLQHGEYYHWVSQILNLWRRILSSPPTDADRVSLVASFEEPAHDIRGTVPELPSFEDLCGVLPRVLRDTLVQEVNTRGGRTPSIEWSRAYPFILVGGQAMDRGFTVEGLTVTYMPRSIGVGNADTVQQRARFLGYKRSYVGYCRVFLEGQAAQAYRRYVTHEEHVRSQLEGLEMDGLPLAEWRRAFFLDGALRPTRVEVLDLAYVQERYSDRWFEPKAPHDSDGALVQNRTVIDSYLRRLALVDDDGHADRTTIQRHRVATGVPLREAYEHLLVPFRMTRAIDQYQYLGIQLQIKAYLDVHPDAQCTVVHMSGGLERTRSLDDNGQIPELFQGANYANGRRTVVYPGDREIRTRSELTIQIHTLRIPQDGRSEIRNVPAIAIWVPRVMAEDWIVQTNNPV
jgi:hypothetical protein